MPSTTTFVAADPAAGWFSHGLALARFGSKTGLIRAVTDKVQRGFLAEACALCTGWIRITHLEDVLG
jgi:hypothetical protein